MLFSATRIVAAIAVLAISGSILLVAAQPGDDTAGPPGAAGDPAMRAPSGVVGNVVGPSGADAGSDGDVVELGDQMFEITGASGIVEWDASDPRLDGSGTRVENGLQHFASHSGLWSGAWTIQNADGTWVGTGNHFSSADGGRDFIIFEGSGAYEGLTAYVTIGASLPAESAGVRPFEGVIFPGEPPAMPEPMALE